MHECLRLYDSALALVRQEAEAIEHGEEELLESLLRERETLMEEAWRKRAGCDPDLVAERLSAIRLAQEAAGRMARINRDNLRLALQSSRRESDRLSGYGRVTNTMHGAFIISKAG